jgi:hypothetical protein
MGEEIHAQERRELVVAPAEAEGKLQILQQQQDKYCPYLAIERVRADGLLRLQIT